MGYIREQRLKVGLRQREVAERCNVSLRVVQKWEQNDEVPRTRDAINVASCLKTHVDEVAGESI